VDVLLHDRRAVLTICSRIEGVRDCDGVTLALPHLVGGKGVLATLPLPLDADESVRLAQSAGVLREALASLRVE
jgi:L-lactate dehydrogenase